jgi:hypothetical protein
MLTHHRDQTRQHQLDFGEEDRSQARAPTETLDFVAAIRAFTYGGKATVEETRRGVPFFFNEFWTSGQRQAHALHEVSYRACFKPQLPEFFINRLTAEGDTVYDPFMGRGTTPVQATLMGRRAIGNDINPLSTYLARPRTNPPTLQEVAARLAAIDWDAVVELPDELLAFYHPITLQQICALRDYLLRREAGHALDRVDDWIRMVATNRLTGHSTGFFSVYSLPPNQAVTATAQRKINEKRGQVPAPRAVPGIILKKSRTLLADGPPGDGPGAEFLVGRADKSPRIADASVDLVVTSPPFLDVVDYQADNWLRCWFTGIDPSAVQIARHKSASDWTSFVHDVFGELGRIVRPGGHVAFEVGEVRNGKVELENQVLDALAGTPFAPLCVLINVQEFTKTANTWGVSNNAKGTNTNRIVVAQRD